MRSGKRWCGMLYMAATRAGQRLVITYVGELPEVVWSILAAE